MNADIPIIISPCGVLRTHFTVDEYLLIERASLERHLYLDGELYEMASESGEHADISVNLVAALGGQLKVTLYRTRTKGTKVRSGPSNMSGESRCGMFTYPDVLVIRHELKHHDAHRDIILNPTVIIEVLSPSTEEFDRGDKFERFKTYNPTLCDYVLVSQDRPQVDRYTQLPDGRWSEGQIDELDASVVLV